MSLCYPLPQLKFHLDRIKRNHLICNLSLQKQQFEWDIFPNTMRDIIVPKQCEPQTSKKTEQGLLDYLHPEKMDLCDISQILFGEKDSHNLIPSQ